MPPELTQLGSAAAAVIVVGMFLRHISSEREKDRETWGNHLSDTVKTLEKLSVTVETILDEAREHYHK